jgi:hypothetical protein
MIRFFTFAVAVVISSMAWAEEIPLKSIWAWEMPGTRDIRELDEKSRPKDSESLASRIAQLLKHRPADTPRPGFAVNGSGIDALNQAHLVLAGEQAEPSSLKAEREVSLIFFAFEFGYYVHIQSVERQNREVTITYEFVPHLTKDLAKQIAIIPMGRLEAGKWKVNIVQAPMAKKYSEMGAKTIAARNVVCGPFEFTLSDGNKK